MKRIEAVGIAVTVALAPGYVALMKVRGEPVEWFVVGFILLMAVALALYATVFRKFTEDTKENRDALVKIVKRAARGGGGRDHD